jgi:hypothetical protein
LLAGLIGVVWFIVAARRRRTARPA